MAMFFKQGQYGIDDSSGVPVSASERFTGYSSCKLLITVTWVTLAHLGLEENSRLALEYRSYF
jgi:hypothetical protein